MENNVNSHYVTLKKGDLGFQESGAGERKGAEGDSIRDIIISALNSMFDELEKDRTSETEVHYVEIKCNDQKVRFNREDLESNLKLFSLALSPV